MSALSKVLRSIEGGLAFYCPGCREVHRIRTGPGGWTWNGDAERPVFSPSVLVEGRRLTDKGDAQWTAWHDAGCPKPAPELDAEDTRCHSFVGCNGAQPGQIVFLSDCTHELRGQVVDLPERWQP